MSKTKQKTLQLQSAKTLQEIFDDKKESVLEKLRLGLPYNQIAKEDHVSVKRITEIKEESLGQKNSVNPAVEVFRCFRSGMKPVDVVVKLGVNPEFVIRCLKTYRQMVREDKDFEEEQMRKGIISLLEWCDHVSLRCSRCHGDFIYHIDGYDQEWRRNINRFVDNWVNLSKYAICCEECRR